MPADRQRKLAAIMFSDIEGYTSIMEENEVLAREMRDRLRSVLEQTASVYGGRIVQYYGDGALSLFASSIEAVKCAVDIQTSVRKKPEIPLRIGIHTGDIVQDDDGVYGDVVNLAARIESIAVPGSVLFSEKVYDDLKNQPGIEAVDLGIFELKNVRKPVEVYAVAAPGLVLPLRRDIEARTVKSYKSIAVLPFANMSADPGNDYFSEGIAEEILNALTKVEGLKVTSRTSSFAFKNRNVDVRDIGRQLGVNTVLEGSVRRAGNRVRVTAQLIDAEDGYHLWSETYERQIEDIFALQDELSVRIVEQLREKLGKPGFRDQLVRHRPVVPEAYNHYLRGLYHLHRLSPEEIARAISCFEEALVLQPDFARAMVRLGQCYGMLGSTGQMRAGKAFETGLDYINRALALDDTLYEAYLLLAISDLSFSGNLERANAHFKKALELNPGAAETHLYYGMFQMTVGNLNEALRSIEKALETDPLSLSINNWYGNALVLQRRFHEAIGRFDWILSKDPTFRAAIEGKAWAQFFRGDVEEAIATFRQFHQMTGHPLKGLYGLGYAYGRLGQRDKALEIVDKIKLRQEQEPETNLHLDLAMVFAGLGDYEELVHHLEKGFEDRSGLTFFFYHPVWEEAKKNQLVIDFFRGFAERKGLNFNL
jgi:adenylate cyclase